jgi:hypothetical protein
MRGGGFNSSDGTAPPSRWGDVYGGFTRRVTYSFRHHGRRRAGAGNAQAGKIVTPCVTPGLQARRKLRLQLHYWRVDRSSFVTGSIVMADGGYRVV